MKRYYISIDQSTTSTKLFLLDDGGNILDYKEKKHKQIYPQDGWVEHDPMQIYENLLQLMKQLTYEHKKIDENLVAITITNQRETALCWDYNSGEVLHNAIVWQCRRTTKLCNKYKAYEQVVTRKTGLKINPYFSATKWVWLLEHCDTNNRDIRLGTMDSWLMYKLSNQKVHLCDHTNASRTLLYNLETLTWDQELLDIFSISQAMLPKIKASDEVFDYTTFHGLLKKDVPIIGVIGDSQAALYAQDCVCPGDVKITLGTGSSILMNQGSEIVRVNKGLVNTLAWKLNQSTMYASEAIINSCGDTLNWLRDELGLFEHEEELNHLTVQELNDEKVIIVPAFHGIALPYWDTSCKASIIGISRNTSKINLMCAGLCSIAYQIHDALQAMQESTGIHIKRIMVDGGVCKNKSLMQFLSNVCDCEIHVKKTSNLSAMGSYKIALSKVQGILVGQEELRQVYVSTINEEERSIQLNRWHQAVKKTIKEEHYEAGAN